MKTHTTQAATDVSPVFLTHIFQSLQGAIQTEFAKNTKNADVRVLTVDTAGLYDAYLAGFDSAADRQHHNCNCCRRFIERFGGLVVVKPGGKIRSALWHSPGVPAPYGRAISAMAGMVEARPIVEGFVTAERVWGDPVTGTHRHFAIEKPAARFIADDPVPVRALTIEHRRTLEHALRDYPLAICQRGRALLDTDGIHRPEKARGALDFLIGLHQDRALTRPSLIWNAVVGAPVGFATPRGGLVGVLLDAIKAGSSDAEVRALYNKTVDPLNYQRAKAAPSAGNLQAAERLIAEKGWEPALHRRFATDQSVESVLAWRPKTAPAARGGVFGHLAAKGERATTAASLSVRTMRWATFVRDVLPRATRIEVELAYSMIITGVLANRWSAAPEILQWPGHLSTYVHAHSASQTAAQFGLPSHGWANVWGIMPTPGASRPNHAASVILLLEGARDRAVSGLGLFPEILKSELHPVRSTVEAFSNNGTIYRDGNREAAGVTVGPKGLIHHLRVTTDTGVQTIRIDNWE